MIKCRYIKKKWKILSIERWKKNISNVLKCDTPKEDKHGKFDHMWVGPYVIAGHIEENAFILEYQNGVLLDSGPVNGRFLKHYLS